MWVIVDFQKPTKGEHMETSIIHVATNPDELSQGIDLNQAWMFFESIGNAAKDALPQAATHKPNDLSPFQAFMNTLLSEQPGKVTTTSGAAEWSSAPIEALIAQGLWPIMMKIAEKQRQEIGTESKVLKQIAPKVEQLINIAIILNYGNPENAAHEFKQLVVKQLAKAKQQTQTFAELVQMPVAKFFAEMLRTVKPARQQLLKSVKELNASNRAFGRCIYTENHMPINTLPAMTTLEWFARNMDGRLVYEDGEVMSFSALGFLGDAVMAHKLAISVARKLPTYASDFDRHDMIDRFETPVITREWLITQMLLAAIDAPIDSGTIGTESYAGIVEHVKQMDDEQIVSATMQRFDARGMSRDDLSEVEWAVLEAKLYQNIVTIKNLSSAGINHLVLTHYEFTQSFVDKHTFSSREARNLAMAKEPLRSRVLANPLTRKKLFTAISWQNVMPNEIQDFMEARVLSAEDIARGMVKMGGNFGKGLGQTWLDTCYFVQLEHKVDLATKQARKILTEAGILGQESQNDPTVSYRDNPELIPSKEKASYLETAIRESVDNEHGSRSLVKHIIQVVRSDMPACKPFFTNPKHRDLIWRFFIDTFFSDSGQRDFGITEIDVELMSIIVGRKAWIKFFLAGEINLRQHEYTLSEESILQTRSDELNLPWAELENHPMVSQRPSSICHHDPDTMRSMLRTPEFSEEGIFRWYNESDPNCKDALKKYLKSRDRYYRILSKK